MSGQSYRKRAYDSGGYGGDNNDSAYGYDMAMERWCNDYSQEEIMTPEFQNFLKNPPITNYNLVPNDQGQVTFNANLGPYTQLFVIAIDESSVA